MNKSNKKSIFTQTTFMKQFVDQNLTAKDKIYATFDSTSLVCQTIKTSQSSIDVIYLNEMVEEVNVSNFVLQSIINATKKKITTLETLQKEVIFCVSSKIRSNFAAMQRDYLNGYCLLFVGNDKDRCLAVDTRTTLGRSIIQPPTSNVTLGPREGFVENIKVNLALIKKRIKNPDLKQVNLTVGKYTNTTISVLYIETISDLNIVNKVIQKIQNINIDGIIDASYISRFLDDKKTTMFKMVGSSEKPDIVCAKMLEGRVAVVVDGSPVVLTVPYLFIEDLQSAEDYYNPPQVASMSRILRFVSALSSLLLPALYVSLQLYNYQIIPAKFLITIINATQAIPFSPITEMVLVMVLFDILREANARMPMIAGLSLSIIGAIILGDAAVKAGLLGAPAVMIGALSSIGLYTMPDNTLLLTLLRLVVTFIGGVMGLLGVLLSTIFIVSYLVSLGAFNSAYMSPFAPDIPSDRQDALIKLPLTWLKKRPQSIKNDNEIRQGCSNEKSDKN